MFRSLLLLCLALVFVGCQPAADQAVAPTEAPSAEAPAAESSVPVAEPAAEVTPEAATEATTVTAGMDMTQVKEIKGVPDETRHEHGPGDEEIDIWVYGEETVRFSDGKVVE